MNTTFSLQETSTTGNLDSSLISRQYKLNLLADFMPTKNENPKLKQSEITNRSAYSSSTLQRYRNDINSLSPYRIQPNNTNTRSEKTSHTDFDNNSHRDPEPKRHQMTSNDLKTTQTNTKSNRKNKKI